MSHLQLFKTGSQTVLLLTAAFGMVEALRAQTTPPAPIASEVAGFASFEVAGAGTAADGKLSLKAIGLLRPQEYQGVAESIRGKMIIDRHAVWANNQFNAVATGDDAITHYLEITAGPLQGAIFDIVRTDAAKKLLVLAQVIPGKAGRTPAYCVRRHWTLGTLFGAANEVGLKAGDETTADLVAIYNGKGYDQFYFASGAATGWRRVGGDLAVDEANHRIYPDDGLAITRRAADGVSALVTGVVKTNRAVVPIGRGMNLIANVYQAPITLDSSRLYTRNPSTGVRAGETAAKADTVLIHNGQTYDTYYYQTSSRNGTGWRLDGDLTTDRGAVAIPVGAAFVVQRRTAGFNWYPSAPKP